MSTLYAKASLTVLILHNVSSRIWRRKRIGI
jgi:hypothetical protein